MGETYRTCAVDRVPYLARDTESAAEEQNWAAGASIAPPVWSWSPVVRVMRARTLRPCLVASFGEGGSSGIPVEQTLIRMLPTGPLEWNYASSVVSRF